MVIATWPRVSGGKPANDYANMGLKVDLLMEDNNFLIPDNANPDSPFADQKIREAVEYCIDREGIAEAFGHGYWKAPYQVPPRASVSYNDDFTLGRKYDPKKANQLLDEAGYKGNPRFKTTIFVAPFGLSMNRDPVVSVVNNLTAVGIQADMEFPEFGKWMSYSGAGTWPKGTLLCSPVPMYDVSFIGGIQFLFNMTGKSWLRTPELTRAFDAAISSTKKDINLIRAVTNNITENALLIPICESGTGFAMRSYLKATFNERGFTSFWNTENFWLNK